MVQLLQSLKGWDFIDHWWVDLFSFENFTIFFLKFRSYEGFRELHLVTTEKGRDAVAPTAMDVRICQVQGCPGTRLENPKYP